MYDFSSFLLTLTSFFFKLCESLFCQRSINVTGKAFLRDLNKQFSKISLFL